MTTQVKSLSPGARSLSYGYGIVSRGPRLAERGANLPPGHIVHGKGTDFHFRRPPPRCRAQPSAPMKNTRFLMRASTYRIKPFRGMPALHNARASPGARGDVGSCTSAANIRLSPLSPVSSACLAVWTPRSHKTHSSGTTCPGSIARMLMTFAYGFA